MRIVQLKAGMEKGYMVFGNSYVTMFGIKAAQFQSNESPRWAKIYYWNGEPVELFDGEAREFYKVWLEMLVD